LGGGWLPSAEKSEKTTASLLKKEGREPSPKCGKKKGKTIKNGHLSLKLVLRIFYKRKKKGGREISIPSRKVEEEVLLGWKERRVTRLSSGSLGGRSTLLTRYGRKVT